MATKRKPIPKATATNILVCSRRRCCLCFGLNGDYKVKRGQIAHLDRDSTNAAEDNLAFLCLEHHDAYDSGPGQTRGFTPDEAKHYKSLLYAENDKKYDNKDSLIELTIDGDINSFDDDQAQLVVGYIENALKAPHQVKIILKLPGSVRLILAMPRILGERLLALPKQDNLSGIHIIKAEFVGEKETASDVDSVFKALLAAMDSLDEAVFIKNRDRQFIYVNEAFAKAVGTTSEMIVGNSDSNYYTDEVATIFRMEDEEVLRGAPITTVDKRRLRDLRNHPQIVRVSKMPFRDEQQNIIGIIGIIHVSQKLHDASWGKPEETDSSISDSKE